MGWGRVKRLHDEGTLTIDNYEKSQPNSVGCSISATTEPADC